MSRQLACSVETVEGCFMGVDVIRRRGNNIAIYCLIAVVAPAVPIVARIVDCNFETSIGRTVYQKPVTFADFEASVQRGYLGRTAPNDDFGLFGTRDVDSVQSIFVEDEGRIGSVDLESGEGRSESLEANDGGSFSQFKLCDCVSEIRNRDSCAFRKPDVVPIS
jgi:hypothetical protein